MLGIVFLLIVFDERVTVQHVLPGPWLFRPLHATLAVNHPEVMFLNRSRDRV